MVDGKSKNFILHSSNYFYTETLKIKKEDINKVKAYPANQNQHIYNMQRN